LNKNVVNRTFSEIFLEGTAAHYEVSRRHNIKNHEIDLPAPDYFGKGGAGIISDERAIAPLFDCHSLA